MDTLHHRLRRLAILQGYSGTPELCKDMRVSRAALYRRLQAGSLEPVMLDAAARALELPRHVVQAALEGHFA